MLTVTADSVNINKSRDREDVLLTAKSVIHMK